MLIALTFESVLLGSPQSRASRDTIRTDSLLRELPQLLDFRRSTANADTAD